MTHNTNNALEHDENCAPLEAVGEVGGEEVDDEGPDEAGDCEGLDCEG